MWGGNQPFELILVVAAHPIKFPTSYKGDPFDRSNRGRTGAFSGCSHQLQISDLGNNRPFTSAIP